MSPALTFQTLPREAHFPTMWENERAKRRDLFAPKWNFKRRLMTTSIPWEKVYGSWDGVNENIHLSTKKHVQTLSALRMTTASTKTSGTWIYAVWSLRDDKVYIGQTGARIHRRTVGKRGSEHVRLALDALRLSGTGISLPSEVYSWISRLGVENFIVTPLEHTTPHQANAREKWWMLRWGLPGLFNRDLPSLSNKEWLFLSDRKIWQKEISAQGARCCQSHGTSCSGKNRSHHMTTPHPYCSQSLVPPAGTCPNQITDPCSIKCLSIFWCTTVYLSPTVSP